MTVMQGQTKAGNPLAEVYRVSGEDEEFLQKIIDVEGVKAHACLSCGSCSGSCPLSFSMDYTPRQIMRFLQLGMKEKVLSSSTIWLCASCYGCTVLCPREIKITDVMGALKRIAINEYKDLIASKSSYTYYNTFMKSIEKNGIIDEKSFFITYQLKTRGLLGLLNYAPFGYSLFRKGKISLRTHKIRQLDSFRMIFRKTGQMEQ
ncbi:MAG: 4Fe-4S dicluster domain-containing protein [Candidatus Bathyarchaeia archaeon]